MHSLLCPCPFSQTFFSMLILCRYARFIRWDRLFDSITPSAHRTYSTSTCAMDNISLLQRGFDPIVDLCTKYPPKFVCDASERRYRQSAWAQSSIVVTSPLSFKGFFRMQATDDETRVEEMFFSFRLRNMDVPFCVLFVDACTMLVFSPNKCSL